MNRKKAIILIVLLSFLILAGVSYNLYLQAHQNASENNKSQTTSPEQGHYGVSAGNPYAVEIGMEVLKNGGNAVDAAIAVSYALGVVQPYGSGMGGGGVMLIYPSDDRKPIIYDYLGTSPSDGTIPAGYVGIPGFVLTMETLATDLGSMPIKELIQPSVNLAENGFKIDPALNTIIVRSKDKLMANSPNEFYDNGIQPGTGMNLKQPELALSLKKIQEEGSNTFYNGEIGKLIIDKVKGISQEDLSSYKVIKREPVIGEYKGWQILSAPPPFAGITLIQILEMSESMKVGDVKVDSKSFYNLYRIINAAYKDRINNIADPAFIEINNQEMVSKAYIEQLIIKSGQTLTSIPSESEDTTHFVIIDQNGMMVSCSNSLSSWFGSGINVGGFFLNNHLTNFNKNTYSVNKWEAGKRPRTFMSPTILAKDGKPVLGIGTPGGNRIPTVLAQILISIIGKDEDPQIAIDSSRFYLKGNILFYEDTLEKNVADVLNANGIRTIQDNVSINYGAVNTLYYDELTGEIKGGADNRRGGYWEAK
jgi:gamma-glutamyltranspeptidase/glutathione hydrolase